MWIRHLTFLSGFVFNIKEKNKQKILNGNLIKPISWLYQNFNVYTLLWNHLSYAFLSLSLLLYLKIIQFFASSIHFFHKNDQSYLPTLNKIQKNLFQWIDIIKIDIKGKLFIIRTLLHFSFTKDMKADFYVRFVANR
jgi:hypothetical protein